MDLLTMYTICTHQTTRTFYQHVYLIEPNSEFEGCLKHKVTVMISRNMWEGLHDLRLKRMNDALKDVL